MNISSKSVSNNAPGAVWLKYDVKRVSGKDSRIKMRKYTIDFLLSVHNDSLCIILLIIKGKMIVMKNSFDSSISAVRLFTPRKEKGSISLINNSNKIIVNQQYNKILKINRFSSIV
jgi:hypothetical protein